MQKVVFFFPDVVGGVFSVVNNLVKFATNATGTLFIAYSNTDEPRKEINPADADAPVTKCRLHGKDNLYHKAKRLRAQLPPNTSVIVATDSAELMMVSLCRLKLPVVYIVLGDFAYYYRVAEIYSGVIDKYICISREIFDKLSDRLPQRKDDILLAYFPTPLVKIKRQARTSATCRIIYVARLEEGKNPLILSTIDDFLIQQNISARWEIVGDGPLKAPLQKLTTHKNNFNFPGFLNNEALHKLYIEQDIFILPSNSEGLPVSLIEAMKTGLVPVVSDITGGIREVVQDGNNGFLCGYDDAQRFAECIATLYNNPEQQEQMAARAIQSSESLFDPVVNSNRYWEIFSQAMLSNRPKLFNPVPMAFLDKSWLPNRLVRWFRNRRNFLLPKS